MTMTPETKDPLDQLAPAARARLSNLLSDPPLLHHWKGQWRLGGFKSDEIRLLVAMAAKCARTGGTFVETGAGLSTLALLCLTPKRMLSIAPDSALFERIVTAADRFQIATDRFEQHVAVSEVTLPALVLGKEPTFDFALIDGGHNFTQVWVDFVYLNYGLRRGGMLAVDDLQLFPCQQLALYLNDNPGWDLVNRTHKTAYFRKRTDRRLEADFGASGLVMANSLVRNPHRRKVQPKEHMDSDE